MRLAVTFVSLLLASHAWSDYRDGTEALKAKDYQLAAKEFKSQAQIGYAKATMAFANMLKKGQTADAYAASAWFALAQEQGEPKASRALKSALKNLSDDELAEHHAQAKSLIDRYGSAALDSNLLPSNTGKRTEPNFPLLMDKRIPATMSGMFSFIGSQILDFEFDVDKYGQARDYQLYHKATDKYIDHAIKQIQAKQLSPAVGHRFRMVYTRYDLSPEQYGDARLLRKLKKRAETGSPYRKYYYAHAQEVAESLNHKYSALDSNEWYLKAAQGGYAKAQYIVGRRILHGEDFDPDQAKGTRWLELSSDNGDPYASYLLAKLSVFQGNEDRAQQYFQRASDQGHTTAQLLVARACVLSGKVDQAQALLEAAEDHLDKVTWHYTAALIANAQGDKSAASKHRDRVSQWLSTYGFSQAVAEDLDVQLAETS